MVARFYAASVDGRRCQVISPSRAWLIAIAIGFFTAVVHGAEPSRSDGAGNFLVLAEDAENTEAAGIQLPSAAAGFGTFDQVSEAVQADRARMAQLEARLKDLEQQAAEPLPAPKSKEVADAAKKAEGKDKADGKDKAAEKKPAAPYEIGKIGRAHV